MNTSFDCYSCFIDQAIRACRLVTDDEEVIKEVISRVGESFRGFPLDQTPPEMGAFIYGTVRELTGVEDPYKELKAESIQLVKDIYPGLLEKIRSSADPLLTAIKLATIGNVLDFGISRAYDLREEVDRIQDMSYTIFHYDSFRSQLEKSAHVLYIGDNAGESVFDRLLIEQLGKRVTYVVREVPIINDVTHQDALDSGIAEVAGIISSGCTSPGTILKMCNEEFLHEFDKADLVISKGQGNYEGLSNVDRRVFFLLRAKCPVIARNIGIALNDFVFEDNHMPAH